MWLNLDPSLEALTLAAERAAQDIESAFQDGVPLPALAAAYACLKLGTGKLQGAADRLQGRVLARMQGEGVQALPVPGVGKVVYVSPAQKTGLDGPAAERRIKALGAKLRELGVEELAGDDVDAVPLKVSTARATVRFLE